MQHRKDIDGLRAIAVLVVVFFHAKVPLFSGGFVGVDVFFVISGFLISGLIADEVKHERFSFLAFYHRRIRRIVPALLVVYAACMLAAAALMLPSDIVDFGKSLRSSALFVSNLFFYESTGYFDGPADLKPLLHTWSLSIEEQFYLVWPVMFLLVARWRPDWLLRLVATAGAASLVAYVGMLLAQPEAAFFLTPFRIWELMLGALLVLVRRQGTTIPSVSQWLAGVGLVLIAAPVVLADGSHGLGMLAPIPACAGAALLIVAGPQASINRLLSLKPVVAVGLVSYSLYLWHWPFLSFARYYVDRPLTWLETGSLLTVSLAAAALTYRFVERPARAIPVAHFGAVLGGGLLMLSLFAFSGQSMARGHDWAFNVHPGLRELDEIVRSESPYKKACFGADNAFRNNDTCTFGRPRENGSFDMAVMGDSHANHFVPTIAILAQAAGLSGRQITVGGCLAFLGYENRFPRTRAERCPTLRDSVVGFVEQNPKLKLVVLAHRWSAYSGTLSTSTEPGKSIYLQQFPNDTTSPERTLEVFRHSLEQTLDFFERHGIVVLLLGEVPPLRMNPTSCIAKSIWNDRAPETCGRSEIEVRGDIAATAALLIEQASRRPNVTYVSPTSSMCASGWCAAVQGGVDMYRDRSHLNLKGAERLAGTLDLRLKDLTERSRRR
jgi:peptidoglycan/LPS O-acetylase OafA/YrhL